MGADTTRGDDFAALAGTVRKVQQYEETARSDIVPLAERLVAQERGYGYREALDDVARALGGRRDG